MKLKLKLIGLCLVLFSSSIFAAELKVVGQAKMRWLMFPLYLVTLKTSDGRYEEGRFPQMLDILYLRNID